MKRTDIGWTDFSSNPLQYRDRRTGKVVWACVKKSSGCANCYSESIARHFDRGGPFTASEMEHLDPFLDDKELRHILTAKTIGGVAVSGGRCFLGDMTDVFGEWVPDEMLDRLFAVMALRSDVTFQVLTKRPERMARYMAPIPMGDGGPSLPRGFRVVDVADSIQSPPNRVPSQWPLPNVWLGTSVENQKAADERIPHLLKTPAAVRFLSCEPLLGEVSLRAFHIGWSECVECGKVFDPNSETPLGHIRECNECESVHPLRIAGHHLHWCIVGGESGGKHRAMQPEWAASIVRQCEAAGVPCFVKQDSGLRPGKQGRLPLDVWQHKGFPEVTT